MANDDDEPSPSDNNQSERDCGTLLGEGKTTIYRPPDREKSESALHNPFLHLMLPSLILILLAFFGGHLWNAPKPDQGAKQIETLNQQMEQDIRDGTASESELILNGIDPKEYRKKIGPLQKNWEAHQK
jgi:hypothetical protein